MRRTITVGILIFACFLLQSSIFTTLDLGGITPNLLIILTASFGFMRGEKEGMFIGFVCGLLMDIFFAEYMGLYSLVYLYIGFFNGKFKKIFYPDDIKLPITLIIFSDLLYGLMCYVSFLLRGKFHFGYYFLHIVLPEIVYTIIITIALYPLILIINKKLDNYEKGRAKKFV